MDNILKIIGVILFLALASVSLAIRFKLTKYQDGPKKDKKESKSVLSKIIRNSFMMK